MLAACFNLSPRVQLELAPVPDEDGRSREVPHRADDDSGEGRKPPLVMMMEGVGGDANIADEADRADRIEGEQAANETPAALAGVTIGQDVVEDVVGRHRDRR